MRDNYGPCAVPRKGTPGWCRHQTTSRHGAAGRARIVTGRTRPDDLADAVRLDAPATRHRLDEEQATTGRRLLVRLGEEWHPVTGVGDATRRTSAGQASRSSSRSSLCRAALVTSSLTASSAAAAVSPITPHSSSSCLVNRRASVTAAGDGGSRRTIRRAPESLVSEVTRAATSAMSSSPVGARHASSSSASCAKGSCSDDASTAHPVQPDRDVVAAGLHEPVWNSAISDPCGSVLVCSGQSIRPAATPSGGPTSVGTSATPPRCAISAGSCPALTVVTSRSAGGPGSRTP